ncbi:MAG: hypothetical protein AB7Q16_09845 [Vicinamibacterales bacterium]
MALHEVEVTDFVSPTIVERLRYAGGRGAAGDRRLAVPEAAYRASQ